MEKNTLDIIKQLMDQLQDAMKYTPDDLESRLGRKKPDAVMIKVEKDDPMLGKAEEKTGMDLDGDREIGEDPEHAAMVMGGDDDDMPPEDDLKSRIMRMRG